MPRRQPRAPVTASVRRWFPASAAALVLAAWLVPLACGSRALAQFSAAPVALSSSVTLEEADSAVRDPLERIKA
jgi:hypothetical protein